MADDIVGEVSDIFEIALLESDAKKGDMDKLLEMIPDACKTASRLLQMQAEIKGDDVDGGEWRKLSPAELYHHLSGHVVSIGTTDEDTGFSHAVLAFVRAGMYLQQEIELQQEAAQQN